MKEIMALYYEINNIYLELFKLDVNDNKDSVIFLELINLLNEKRKLEDDIFKKLYSNISNDEYEKYNSVDEIIDNPFIKRFCDYIRFNNELNIRNEDNNRISYARLYIACTRNIFLIYLSFLQELIDDNKYNSFRKKLISYKYYNSFICHDVEYMNILNKFNVNRDNYVNLYFIGRTLKLDYNEVRKIIFECLEDTVMTTISGILNINDEDYNEIDKYVLSLNNQCMLRAGLSMLNENEYGNLKEDINDLINSLVNDNNSISLNNINIIIDERKNSKSRVRKISFMFEEE